MVHRNIYTFDLRRLITIFSVKWFSFQNYFCEFYCCSFQTHMILWYKRNNLIVYSLTKHQVISRLALFIWVLKKFAKAKVFSISNSLRHESAEIIPSTMKNIRLSPRIPNQINTPRTQWIMRIPNYDQHSFHGFLVGQPFNSQPVKKSMKTTSKFHT